MFNGLPIAMSLYIPYIRSIFSRPDFIMFSLFSTRRIPRLGLLDDQIPVRQVDKYVFNNGNTSVVTISIT
jgi:hypothetical protein